MKNIVEIFNELFDSIYSRFIGLIYDKEVGRVFVIFFLIFLFGFYRFIVIIMVIFIFDLIKNALNKRD